MLILADSGSTKTDWCFVDGENTVHRAQTAGINPVHMSETDIQQIVSSLPEHHFSLPAPRSPLLENDFSLPAPRSPLPENPSPLPVYFYGAGCIPPFSEKVERALRGVFGADAQVEVASDLLGAARAVCGTSPGLACILGTGANSGCYDGREITDNIPPLGYVLGDEGSGAALGRLFLNALFKRRLPEAMLTDYLNTTGLTYKDIIERVYRQPLANRFLASTSLYIYAHAREEAVDRLIRENFRQFIRCNLRPYNHADWPLGVVGSIGHCYEKQLREVAQEEGYSVGRVLRSPIDGMLEYHLAINRR